MKKKDPDLARVDTPGDSADSRTAPDIEAWVARLRTLVDTVDAMPTENERRAALYYVVARFYGNRTGDRLLALLDGWR